MKTVALRAEARAHSHDIQHLTGEKEVEKLNIERFARSTSGYVLFKIKYIINKVDTPF